MNIALNYFELFQLPESCEVDTQQLLIRYRELQKQVHPDRYADESYTEQQLSIQYAAYVNEAYETLKVPLRRFLYLLEIAGHPVDMEKNTVMAPAFLMEQMSLRESVAEIKAEKKDFGRLESLVNEVDASLAALSDEFVQCWSARNAQRLNDAETIVRKMQFNVRVAAELEELESEWFD